MHFRKGVLEASSIWRSYSQRALKESEGARMRYASSATYGLLLDKNEAKEDNTLQRDRDVPPDPLHGAAAPIQAASVNAGR